jgi:hypothetical protein
MLQRMGHSSRPSFERLAPVSDRYASLPVAEAFTWHACEADVAPGEWYMVAFRSTRLPGVDEAQLSAYDDWAHAEAMDAPGFVHYFKGPTVEGGRCMSFCLWDSRAEARSAASRPAHARAVALTHQSYAEYNLEFLRVRRTADGFAIEPYDPVPAPADDASMPARESSDPLSGDLPPNLAPGLAPT